MPHTDSFSFFHNLFFSCPSLTRACRSFLLLLPLAALAACSGDDEPPMPAAPAGDLQEVTLYLNLPALADSASKRSLGDPGERVEEGEDWNTLVLFIVYESPEAPTQEVRIKTLTDEEYGSLPPSAAGSPFKRYTLTAPAGEVYFYGLTYHAPEAGENLPGATALGNAIAACSTKVDVEGLTISNYYPYDGSNSSTDVAKFCSVASGYYDKDGDGTPDDFTIDYSQIETDLTKIPTLTLRRLAAKIDVQWDAQAAYTDGDLVQPSVEGFQFIGRAEGKVFPEFHKSSSASPEKRWDFYNTTPISQRFGRVYHYTFPDGNLAPKVTFTVKTNTNSKGEQYTLQWNTDDYLRRATWYKVNATVKGNNTGGIITISGWDDGTSSSGN